MNILVLGADGYTGSRLVSKLIERGHRVRGLVHKLEQGIALEKLGMELRAGDLSRIEDIRTIAQEMEVIYNLVGYCRADTPLMRAVLAGGVENLLQTIDRETVKKYIWASNVSVYGSCKPKARLDETSPVKPSYALGKVTVEIEKRVAAELPAVAVRVPSVYGPGRDYMESLKAGRLRLLNAGENWQSRIHVDDLVQVLLAALDKGAAGAVYLAGDDLPTTAHDFFFEVAEAIGAPPPLLLEANAARAFGTVGRALNWFAGQTQINLNENLIGQLTNNYYCMNGKIKKELGVQLIYPTFRDAYEEMLTGKRSGK
ncbi:MAG: NAD-dependent epimerase/dehydratase family protein [Anaerolineae bacterium]